MGHAPLHGKNQSSKITMATSALPPNSIDQSPLMTRRLCEPIGR
jgi:hypothetical protein